MDFRDAAMLVRGASDTGKSYIRDCLWYLLGGDKLPKKIPEASGYDLLTLELAVDGDRYEVRRAHAGGDSSLAKVCVGEDGNPVREILDEDIGDFLVRYAGAAGKQLLRSRSKRGGVTGGDLRHWFLLSQPTMISEDATAGPVTNATQRIAAFHMFLTGTDDSAIELVKTSKELDRIAGQILGVEEALRRIRADLPEEETRDDVANALARVDVALGAMTSHYEARASSLKGVRDDILKKSAELQAAERERNHCLSMVERFELLDAKYKSDSERLGATWEGVAMFQALEEVPCPLCGTPAEVQVDPRQLRQGVQDNYRKALKAEFEKIVVLRQGLTVALAREHERAAHLRQTTGDLRAELNGLEATEKARVNETRYEFSGDPKSLAVRRSALSEQLAKFDGETQLIAELTRLTNAKKQKKMPLSRNVGDAATQVAAHAKRYLHAWGFTSIQSVLLDADACDLILDSRARLDFGAGKRAIFLAALTIAVMEHAVGNGYPHLGFAVIDSPLKSYADPKSKEQRDVEVSTVTDRFYAWLAKWEGPGQLIILENQEIKMESKTLLKPLEFVGDGDDEGRRGFYPGMPKGTNEASA
ncbi:Rad50/SbcC-type AAA domain-containing protein [Burkholderia pseudomallei]